MARGQWEDFEDKYGFNDGDSVDTLDFAARDFLVRVLNQNPIMREKNLRAIAYHFAGVHNAARILILKDEGRIRGKSSFEGDLPEDAEVLALPEELRDAIADLVDGSYDQAWDVLTKQKKRIVGKKRKKQSRRR
jgi:hypothetical protein